jgi:hypothetical protein
MTPVKFRANGSGINLMQNEDENNHSAIAIEDMGADFLPMTKIPLLNTVDQYVVPRNTEEQFENTSPIDICCQFQQTDVVDRIFEGYSRFISAFTGLDELVFAFASDSDSSVLPDSHGCVHAQVKTQKPDHHSELQSVTFKRLSSHVHEFDKERNHFGIQVEGELQGSSDHRCNKVCSQEAVPGLFYKPD